jgi:transcriptional regulator with XRE-family HTH domain
MATKLLDTSYYDRRRRDWLADDDARGEYERAHREIELIDTLIRSLDELRESAGMSKAELARRVGRNPASIRRLFTAEQVRPELPLIVSIADALNARIEIKVRSKKSAPRPVPKRSRGKASSRPAGKHRPGKAARKSGSRDRGRDTTPA